jgi:hypothetical protein
MKKSTKRALPLQVLLKAQGCVGFQTDRLRLNFWLDGLYRRAIDQKLRAGDDNFLARLQAPQHRVIIAGGIA